MSYNYFDERDGLFSDVGQRLFLTVRDRVCELLARAGAVSMIAAISGFSGSSWAAMACVDRLVELGEIREVTPEGVAGQDRVFVSAKRGGQ